MLNRFHFISAVSGLATLAALLVSGSASAARIEAFQARAETQANQPCVSNYWTGVYNTCAYTVNVQAAVTVASSGNYSTNAFAYGYYGSTTFTPWSVSSTLDFISTPGTLDHTTGVSNAPTWSTFTSSSLYVASSGAILIHVTLAPSQILSYFTY